MQIAREGADLFHHRLVAADQPVVAHDGRNGDAQTDGGHDQGFTDGARDLVDRRLAGDTDLRQGAVDTPNGTEQADERSGGADGGQERFNRLVTVEVLKFSNIWMLVPLTLKIKDSEILRF